MASKTRPSKRTEWPPAPSGIQCRSTAVVRDVCIAVPKSRGQSAGRHPDSPVRRVRIVRSLGGSPSTLARLVTLPLGNTSFGGGASQCSSAECSNPMNTTLCAAAFVRLRPSICCRRSLGGLAQRKPPRVLGIVGTETPAPWPDKGGRPPRDTAPQAASRGVSDGTRTRDRLDHNGRAWGAGGRARAC
jgi:hypothetical protein